MEGNAPRGSDASASPVRVFLSYRRSDDRHLAGRLRDLLAQEFGDDNVFFDVDSIAVGDDFRVVIREYIDEVDVMLALIGPRWRPEQLSAGNDFVRMELHEALQQDKPVIPVLIDNTSMPSPQELPDELDRLAYLNACVVRPDPDFRGDAARLARAVRMAHRRAGDRRARNAASPPGEAVATAREPAETAAPAGLDAAFPAADPAGRALADGAPATVDAGRNPLSAATGWTGRQEPTAAEARAGGTSPGPSGPAPPHVAGPVGGPASSAPGKTPGRSRTDVPNRLVAGGVVLVTIGLIAVLVVALWPRPDLPGDRVPISAGAVSSPATVTSSSPEPGLETQASPASKPTAGSDPAPTAPPWSVGQLCPTTAADMRVEVPAGARIVGRYETDKSYLLLICQANGSYIYAATDNPGARTWKALYSIRKDAGGWVVQHAGTDDPDHEYIYRLTTTDLVIKKDGAVIDTHQIMWHDGA